VRLSGQQMVSALARLSVQAMVRMLALQRAFALAVALVLENLEWARSLAPSLAIPSADS
jgi:hypothetical protein